MLNLQPFAAMTYKYLLKVEMIIQYTISKAVLAAFLLKNLS